MNAAKILSKSNRAIDAYLTDLSHYTIEELQRRPATGWSLGQVYIHLWMSAKGFFFKNAEKCLSNDSAVRGKGKTWVGKLVFLTGHMPAVRIRMPESVAVEPKMPESKEYIVSKFEEIRTLCDEYVKRLPNSDLTLKTRHPFLGYLNAAEWVTLCQMHMRHHEAQKRRLQKFLRP
ncbi:MAG: DinB family protein [Chitinophagales bacterium]